MNRTLYTLLLHLALPLIALRLYLRGRKAPAYRRRIAERFAFQLPPLKPGGIWVHAVSVGESIAAAPLIRALRERYPELPITITCMTPTGSERIRALFGDQVQHCYLPYDLPWAAARFLGRVRPKLVVIMETELWPNHIHQCVRRGIPTVLANARLSEKSARGYARFAGLTGPMLAEMSWIAAQTEAEAERDLSIDPELKPRAQALRASWGADKRPVWIAASTHAGEDEIILAAHRQLLAEQSDGLLILVPRHPERFDAVHVLCQREGFTMVRRSSGLPVGEGDQVLLGDTMGELLFLYALADEGHNLLEPAALGLPVLTGPHLFNFLEIAAQLRAVGALGDVGDGGALTLQLLQLLGETEQRQRMCSAGLKVIHANQGALERLLDELGRYL